jgi:hypothetical protein
MSGRSADVARTSVRVSHPDASTVTIRSGRTLRTVDKRCIGCTRSDEQTRPAAGKAAGSGDDAAEAGACEVRRVQVGLSGFQLIQEEVEYGSRTHHSNMDMYERVQANDMMRNAVIVGSFAMHAANRDEKLPRTPCDLLRSLRLDSFIFFRPAAQAIFSRAGLGDLIQSIDRPR